MFRLIIFTSRDSWHPSAALTIVYCQYCDGGITIYLIFSILWLMISVSVTIPDSLPLSTAGSCSVKKIIHTSSINTYDESMVRSKKRGAGLMPRLRMRRFMTVS